MQRQDDDNARSPLLNLLIVVTLATIVVAVWYLLDYYLRGSTQDVTWYPPDTPCDLNHSACHADLGLHAGLILSVGDKLALREPLAIDVTLEGIDARRVSVEFIGRSRNLGVSRFPLDDLGNGHFHGQGQLGVYTEEAMRWRAQVLVETAKGRKGSWFDFDVVQETP